MNVTTPGLGGCISGAILYDETVRQQTKNGLPFIRAVIAAGVIPGIKADTGAKDLAGHPEEKKTEGFDGLRARLPGPAALPAGRRWRTVRPQGGIIPATESSADSRRATSGRR